MDKYEIIKQQFLSDDNAKAVQQQSGGQLTYIGKYMNIFINDAVIRNNDFKLQYVNSHFVKWLRSRQQEPLQNEIMTRDDEDELNYDSLQLKRPWLRSNKEVNMFDLIKAKQKRAVPQKYCLHNRYGTIDELHPQIKPERETPIYKQFSQEYNKDQSQGFLAKYSQY